MAFGNSFMVCAILSVISRGSKAEVLRQCRMPKETYRQLVIDKPLQPTSQNAFLRAPRRDGLTLRLRD
ncbi:hypothetical protein XAXN_10750 [Xanthomonas axonopodis]|uniref:Uncharacterized protein n=1 Tax=Xanthomonas axonopodis TaxID=53413 RepID=A0A0P6W3R2_9XANT|nr:hypothetical protein XAXN_10750 [Xanthomonas axonopodis]